MTRRPLLGIFCVAVFCSLSSLSHATDLELVLRGGPFTPTDAEGGLAVLGVEGGASVLLRPGERFAFGGTIDTAWVRWNARGSSDGVVIAGSGFPDPKGSVQSSFHALTARWYPVVTPVWSGYLDVNVGYLSVIDTPDHPDCGDGSGVSGQLALGLDGTLSTWARLGGSFGMRPLRMGRGCNGVFYPGQPPDPPHGGFALSGQVAFTAAWSSL